MKNPGHRHPITLWFTGLSGAGKTTIASRLSRQLTQKGYLCCVLDGDNIRRGLNQDLGFTPLDRRENIRRVAQVAHLLNGSGIIVITSLITPYRILRRLAKQIIGNDHFIEVFIDAPLAVCEARDTKGLYKKARAGGILKFTGISDPYEPPQNAEIHLRTDRDSVNKNVTQILDHLKKKGSLPKK